MFKGEIQVGEKTFAFNAPKGGHHTLAAQVVSAWTHGEHMIEKSTDDILGLFEKGHSVLVFEKDKLVGHGAITAQYPNNQIEIGGLIVSPEHRHEGAGTAATLLVVTLAEKLFPGSGFFALANPKSGKLLEKLGATPMSTMELCAEVWELCASCPMKPKQEEGKPFICCDTPYDMNPILDVAHQYVISWLSKNIWGNPLPAPYRGHEAGWGIETHYDSDS